MKPGGPTIPITNYQIPTLSATAESREASESPGGPLGNVSIHPGRSMSSAVKYSADRWPELRKGSTGPGVVNAPAPWAPVDLRDGAKTWCVEHFSENAIFAPAARGPKPHLRGPRMYTAPSHRHLLCGVARISRNALVQYSLRDRFWFSWKSGI